MAEAIYNMPRPSNQMHNPQFAQGGHATPRSPSVVSDSGHHQMMMSSQPLIPMTSDGMMTNGPSYIAVGSTEGPTGMTYSRTENESTAQDSTTSGSTHARTGPYHSILNITQSYQSPTDSSFFRHATLSLHRHYLHPFRLVTLLLCHATLSLHRHYLHPFRLVTLLLCHATLSLHRHYLHPFRLVTLLLCHATLSLHRHYLHPFRLVTLLLCHATLSLHRHYLHPFRLVTLLLCHDTLSLHRHYLHPFRLVTLLLCHAVLSLRVIQSSFIPNTDDCACHSFCYAMLHYLFVPRHSKRVHAT